MPKKDFSSTSPRPELAVTSGLIGSIKLPPDITVVEMQRVSSLRRFEFREFYGKGCDQIVYQTQQALYRLVIASTKSGGKIRSPNTIESYWVTGVKTFLPFCQIMSGALGRSLTLDDIDSDLIQKFLTYLKELPVSTITKKCKYDNSKSVLVEMASGGVISKTIFPRNPFPNANRRISIAHPALSTSETARVKKALAIDLTRITKSTSPLNSDDLSVCIIAIAMRTGMNTTPILALRTDCLKPHPLKNNRYLLVSYKRRTSTTHIQSLKRSGDLEVLKLAFPDVEAIIRIIEQRNAELRRASNFPNALFVYERQCHGGTTYVSGHNIKRIVAKFVKRHQLLNDDGEPLALTVMRLRKTFENKMFELSNQSPFLTAKMSFHTLKVSNDHYLEAPKESETNWALMGELRNQELLSTNPPQTKESATPVARCKDSLNGDLAPKNGTHCQKFLACFRCKSFVITGDDLYRVYSFYWMLIRLRDAIGASKWSKQYGHLIRIIEKQVSPAFDAKLIQAVKERAKTSPHPYWREAVILEDAE